jgi:hypothetical protein
MNSNKYAIGKYYGPGTVKKINDMNQKLGIKSAICMRFPAEHWLEILLNIDLVFNLRRHMQHVQQPLE